jgi:hypothetical protein
VRKSHELFANGVVEYSLLYLSNNVRNIGLKPKEPHHVRPGHGAPGSSFFTDYNQHDIQGASTLFVEAFPPAPRTRCGTTIREARGRSESSGQR